MGLESSPSLSPTPSPSPSLSPSPSPGSLSPTPSASRTKLGAVLGGVFGGLAIIVAALFSFLWRNRSRGRKASPAALRAPEIVPFMGETSGMTLPGAPLTGVRAGKKRRDLSSHPPATQSLTMETDATTLPPAPAEQNNNPGQWDDEETPPDYNYPVGSSHLGPL
jgi:hypothetical protein